MRSPLGALRDAVRNVAPVSYVSRQLQMPVQARSGQEQQLRTMGANGTLYAMVNRLSTATAQWDWKLWRKAASGREEDRVQVTKHAALDVWNKPNPFMTRKELMERVQQHLDLCGEGWSVVGYSPMAKTLPLELWPVRPDRMAPLPDPYEFISRYEYTGPNGERIPLERREVLSMMLPNPVDPYRGMGPVQSVLVHLDSARYSAEWNRNFFVNNAEPGGIIEVPEQLGDTQFDEMRDRWEEAHRGITNAHRVAILENGAKFVARTVSQRDMQFAELANVNREILREAFGFPKSMLGTSDDVNRAVAEAQEFVFARWLVEPRLERWKGMLNSMFLPLFGETARDLEFDYESPVSADSATENAALTAKSNAAVTLIGAGFEASEVLEVVDLPEMTFDKPEPPAPPALPAPAPAPEEEEAPEAPTPPDPPAAPGAHWSARHLIGRTAPVWAADVDPMGIDLSGVQGQWERALDRVIGQWSAITDAQRDELVRQIITLVDKGRVADLATISADSADGARLILEAMEGLAAEAAHEVVDEARAQGVYSVAPMVPESDALEATAALTAGLLAAELALSAAREALRVRTPESTGREVGHAVSTHLRALTDAFPRKEIGGALTGAQNAARIETFRNGPVAALYANETLDKSTCGPCRTINGRWLGNSDNGTDMDQVNKLYPTSGYVDCEGGSRCRGTVTGVWRSNPSLGGSL